MIKKARKDIRVYVIPRQLLMYFNLTLMLLTVNMAYAQGQHSLSGVIVSAADNEPIPGVNVIIKGSTNGGITDLDGKYTIQVEQGDVVSVSFMGFLTQEITITDQTILDVALEDNVAMFEELVVVGYGVQQKKLVTGATVQIKSEDIGSRNSTSALQALQGQAPGVNITSSSGQPGEGLKVTIRGLGTIGDASPLYIVDGMQTSDIDYLNPADIASIDVLKDAASAAIYGSRAANGVVLVTTKRGVKGASNITFDAYYGVQNAAKKMEMLNAKQYAQIMNEQHINSGNSQSTMPYDLNNLPIYSGSAAANTNWIDEMFVSNAITQNYVLGASGGSETMSYSSSLAYTGQEGIVGGSDFSNYERLSARFNSEKILYDGRLKFGENLSFAYITQNGIGVGNQYNNSLRGAFNASPLLPMYDNNGAYFNTNDKSILDQNGNTYTNDAESNPYASMVYNNQNINQHQKLIGSVYAELEIIRNLKYRSSVGFDLYNGQSRTYKPEYQLSRYDFADTNVASQRMSKSLSYTLDNILTYDYNLGVSKFNFMAGTSAQVSSGEWMYASNSDVVFEGIDYAYLNNATNQEWARLGIQGAPNDDEKLLSYFGRIQYNYNSTYMFNASFRADGSSKFAQGNQWGYFPAMSAGWVLSNEDFMRSVVDQVGFLKLRASWGQNGNQNIASFQYSAPISFSNVNYAFGDVEGTNTPGSYPSRLENVNIKWETSQQLNIGLDARILNDKLGINIDWYNKTTKDWLVKPPILATAGTNAPFVNGGEVQNKGFELALSYTNSINDFRYSVSLNGAYNKNIVNDIPTEDGVIHGSTGSLYDNSPEFYRAVEGRPVGFFWGLESDGIFQDASEVLAHKDADGNLIQPNAKPGDARFVLQDGATGVYDDTNKTMVGDPNPDYTYGISINLAYKGFDLSMVGTGVGGNEIVQSYRSQNDKNANYTTAVLDRWNGKGTSNTTPRVTNDLGSYEHFSDLYIQDGSYFRIANLTLGYDLKNVLNETFFSKFRIYGQVQNLVTFTKYDGMDPEVGFGDTTTDGYSFGSGIDLGYYPRARSIILGLNMKF